MIRDPSRSESTAGWEQALEDVADRLSGADIRWMLVGSAATAVHGAAIEPGDIDILLPTSDQVYAAAAILPNCAEPSTEADPLNWHSSVQQPVLTWTDPGGTAWTFGRWTIQDTKVELANLRPSVPSDKLVETGASHALARDLEWRGRRLPILPVELQIGTMITRDQQQRLTATLAATDVSRLDVSLLRRTIADHHISPTDPRVPPALQHLLVAPH